LPRYLETAAPHAAIDVVEIDPAVTRTAVSFFGLSPESSIRTFNEDARWYVMRTPLRYDAVFVDVFNDLSVPYHLTTEELDRLLGERLTWDGVVAANVIDSFERGRFLPSYLRTMQRVFGRANVALVMESSEDMEAIGSTFVVLASPRLRPLLESLERSQSFQGYVLRGEDLERYLGRARPALLTDDYAPVDNMLAARFAERFIDD
jgi:spermidine synthase